MQFPIFRKYTNEKSYFIIETENSFTEYKINPGGLEIHKIEAKILPDRIFIQDMIDLKDGHWLSIEELEFNTFRDTHIK